MAFQETFTKFLVGLGADLKLKVSRAMRNQLYLGNISITPLPAGEGKVTLLVYSKSNQQQKRLGPFPEADFSKNDSDTRRTILVALREYI